MPMACVFLSKTLKVWYLNSEWIFQAWILIKLKALERLFIALARKIRRHCGGWQTSHEKNSLESPLHRDPKPTFSAGSGWPGWKPSHIFIWRMKICLVRVLVACGSRQVQSLLMCHFCDCGSSLLPVSSATQNHPSHYSFSCQEYPGQWVMQQQPGVCPGPCEARRRGTKSGKEDMWVVERSTSSSYVPYVAKPALVTPNTAQSRLSLGSFNHLLHCSCNSRLVNNQKEATQAEQFNNLPLSSSISRAFALGATFPWEKPRRLLCLDKILLFFADISL